MRYGLTDRHPGALDRLTGARVLGEDRYLQRVMALDAVAYWPLEDRSGLIAEERISGLDCDYLNGPTLGVASPLAGVTAVGLDGVNDAIRGQDWPDIQFRHDGQWSASAWIKTSSNIAVCPISKVWVPSGGWMITLDSSISFRLVGTTSQKNYRINVSADLRDGQWHHLVCVFDGADYDHGIYIDGIKQAHLIMDSLPIEPIVYDIPLYIGSRPTDQRLSGSIWRVSLHDRLLSPADVAALYGEVMR